TAPAFTALSTAKSSSNCTCVPCTSWRKYREKTVAWSATSINPCSTVFGATAKTRATARIPSPSATAVTALQYLGRGPLALPGRTLGLQKVLPATPPVELAPATTTGIAIGPNIPQPHPTIIGTVRLGTKLRRGVHLARSSLGGAERQGGG